MYNYHISVHFQTHAINARKVADDIADTEAELFFHQDLIHYEGPPGLTILNCIRYIACAICYTIRVIIASL